MKSILKTVPEMYADWMDIGWTMLLGKSPTSPTIDPKRNSAQAAAERGRVDKGVSGKPAKMVRTKPAAKKSSAKPAARKASTKPAAKKSPAKKRHVSGKRR